MTTKEKEQIEFAISDILQSLIWEAEDMDSNTFREIRALRHLLISLGLNIIED